jgi:hypothetical protein
MDVFVIQDSSCCPRHDTHVQSGKGSTEDGGNMQYIWADGGLGAAAV